MSDRMPPVDPSDDPVVWPADETRVQDRGNVPPPPLGPDDELPWWRENLPWILIAVLGVVILAGVGVWLLTRSSSSGKPVPAVVGLRLDAAVNSLADDGFKAQITRQANPRQVGVVFSQDPGATTSARLGSTVRIYVSNGPRRSTVPNAVGLAQGTARDRLVQAGFTVSTFEVFSDQPTGSVVAQDPSAGARVAPGSKVRINVSKGAGTVDVPSEVGKSSDEAQSDLTALGLKATVTSVPSDQPVDVVVAQSPAGGQVKKGSTVQLNVSDGTQTTSTGTDTTTTDTTTTATTDTTTTDTTTTSGTTTTTP
jgi:serine/threonine-protein kinase